MSDVVSTCEITASTVKITLGKSIDAVDFFVVINHAGSWSSTGDPDDDKVTGKLSSYSMVI